MQILLWVAVLSLLSAAAAVGAIAWRTSRGRRDRESARVELLKALAFPDASGVPASGQSTSSRMADFLSEQEAAPAVDTYEAEPPIFGEREHPPTPLPRWVSLSAVGTAMTVVAAIYAVLGGDPEAARVSAPAAHETAAGASPATVDARTTAVPARPVEVIALEYRFGRATAFSVSGRVRNPVDGRALPDLMAVIDLLDADGRILTSQMTPLERPVLEAGQTSAFSLVFPRVVGTVARYQVGFRVHGRDKIPQIDRRAPEPAAKGPSS